MSKDISNDLFRKCRAPFQGVDRFEILELVDLNTEMSLLQDLFDKLNNEIIYVVKYEWIG